MKKIVLYISIVLLAVACNDEKVLPNVLSAEGIQYDAVLSRKSFSVEKMKSAAIHRKENVTIERKLIKTGTVAFETKELEATRKTIIDLVSQNTGYVASDNQYKSDDRISTTIAVRIPAKSFDLVLEGIAKVVERFDHKNIHISDVTKQFLDVESRLKTKKALEAKYLEILKKARTVREILDVERELGKLRGDIEATEGRLKYLQSQVLFSTLNITFYKKIAESEIGFGSEIRAAFKQGFENVKAFLVSMINVWPFMIILFLLIFYFRKRMKRSNS
jgi:hypothetical protein